MPETPKKIMDLLKVIIEVQEVDMQMIRLMRLKKERQNELKQIRSIQEDLEEKIQTKKQEIIDLKKDIRLGEGDVELVVEAIKKLEDQQSAVKKVDEFNALNHEISTKDKDRVAKEQRLSDMYDKLAAEEELHKSLEESLGSTSESGKALSEEIYDSLEKINEEGRSLKEKHDNLITHCDPEILQIYERLLRNKKDRVVVPIENRACSGCHIILTAQDENLVRKGERLVTCEHCSRVLFWQEVETATGDKKAARQRRRKTASASA